MNAKFAAIGLVAVLLAGCAPPSPPPAPTPPPPPAATPPAPPPAPEPAASTAPIPIRSLSCTELLGASDDDRAAAAMFFIGYQAAVNQVHNLAIAQIQDIEQAALSACAANPRMTAVRAFAQAVRTHRK